MVPVEKVKMEKNKFTIGNPIINASENCSQIRLFLSWVPMPDGVGTEEGYGRNTEWSVVPVELLNQDKIAENSPAKRCCKWFYPGRYDQRRFGKQG